MSVEMATILITYQAQPGRAAQAREALDALIAIVVAEEPACLGIRLHQDSADPHRLLLIEHWTDAATFTGPHMQTPHLQAFIREAGAFLAGPPEITFWQDLTAVLPPVVLRED